MSFTKSAVALTAAAVTLMTGAAMAPSASARPVGDGSSCNYTINEPVLTYGMHRIEVAQLQCQLNVAKSRYPGLGYQRLAVDSSFGNATLAAVRAYQAYFGLQVDGKVGYYTWRSLDSIGW